MPFEVKKAKDDKNQRAHFLITKLEFIITKSKQQQIGFFSQIQPQIISTILSRKNQVKITKLPSFVLSLQSRSPPEQTLGQILNSGPGWIVPELDLVPTLLFEGCKDLGRWQRHSCGTTGHRWSWWWWWWWGLWCWNWCSCWWWWKWFKIYLENDFVVSRLQFINMRCCRVNRGQPHRWGSEYFKVF